MDKERTNKKEKIRQKEKIRSCYLRAGEAFKDDNIEELITQMLNLESAVILFLLAELDCLPHEQLNEWIKNKRRNGS